MGIIGIGRISRAVTRRVEPFGLQTIYRTRNPLSESEAAGTRYISFGELLEESDVISVHVPLNAHTRHLIGQGDRRMMSLS
jgi:lactate dehydrogenase-like 2-hydroxyacid dehydrogenase